MLDNAESEIKRMSDFVDQFTNDAELNKKTIVAEYEHKMAMDKQKGDELKQKLILEKSEIDIKYSKLQKEAEALTQDNMTMQLSKSDAMQKQIEMFEQLEQTK